MKKIICIITSALLLAALLVGCGNDTADRQTVSTDGSTSIC